MTYLDMKYFKIFFSALFSMVICSFKANADLPLPMVSGNNDSFSNNCLNAMTETQEFLFTGDCIMLVGFLFWIAYIIFFFPKNTLQKL